MESFITNIHVIKSFNIEDFNITLSDTQRQHLIITGKNGSGKTTLLQELGKYISILSSLEVYSHFNQLLENIRNIKELETIDKLRINSLDPNYDLKYNNLLLSNYAYDKIRLEFSVNLLDIVSLLDNSGFIVANFNARRSFDFNPPKGIEKVELEKKVGINQKVGSKFIQYIVNLKAQRSFAKDDNELSTVQQIDDWFERFEARLKYIFDAEQFELRFDRISYNFQVVIDGGEPFDFNQMSDGYSSILSIVTELLMRMEAHKAKAYDIQGVVLIDEIETHLHVDLQKKILPFLTDFFPRIQFIVTTHSPFVLSSLKNATIFDLETKMVTNDMSAYSYDTIIESYFNNDKYSDEIKENLSKYEKLLTQKRRSEAENTELAALRKYFDKAPTLYAPELQAKLQSLKLKAI